MQGSLNCGVTEHKHCVVLQVSLMLIIVVLCLFIVWPALSCTDPGAGRIDNTSMPGVSTIRHIGCQLLLPQDSALVHCSVCSTYRSTLAVQSQRLQRRAQNPTPTSHTNHRHTYQPLAEQNRDNENRVYNICTGGSTYTMKCYIACMFNSKVLFICIVIY